MNQELIDLFRGELDDGRADELRARLATDVELAREYAELEALLGLMRRGEEIAPTPAMAATVRSAAVRSCRPAWVERVRALPGLVRFRFRRSIAFRVAVVSLAAHLLLMGVLFQVTVAGRRAHTPVTFVNVPLAEEAPLLEPNESFVFRLRQRRLSHLPRLRQYGVEGQAEAIRAGLEKLHASQRADGSFGDVATTGFSTLALLAEGDCSTLLTDRGRSIRAAIRHLLDRARAGAVHGAALAAIVEDYALSYPALREEERAEYVATIQDLIRRMGSEAAAREGLALAHECGFESAAAEPAVSPEELLERPATRCAATAVLARGQAVPDRGRVRDWLRPLFEASLADLAADRETAIALLSLQSPYRL